MNNPRLSLAVMLCLALCGCVTFDAKEGIIDTSYPTTFLGKRSAPSEIAGYYESNYPTLSENEKAVLVYEECKRVGYYVTLEEKEVVVIKKSVSIAGSRIFPTEKK
jgi:hypothetical protein